MRLKTIRLLGRYMSPHGKCVNVKIGRQIGRNVDVLFYLSMGKKIYISDREFYLSWEEVS